MKKLLIILLSFLFKGASAQHVGLDAFVRLPHIVDYNINQDQVRYTPAIATGLTISYESAFIDCGIFVDPRSTKGYFSYGAISIHEKQLEGDWIFILNGFAELTYLPAHAEQPSVFVKTFGGSPVLVKSFPAGIFALAITIGPAFVNDEISLNSRLILNYALPIKKRKL